MTLSEEMMEILQNPDTENEWLESEADRLIKKVCDACIQAIQDNPHKSPIQAITDMRRKG